MKGHNWGLCKKCGKVYVHGMAGKHHSEEAKRKITRAHKGRPSPFKGVKNRISPEGKRRIAEANRRRVWTPEMRAKVSQSLKGRISPMKGRHLTMAQRLRKSRAMKNSRAHQEAMRKRRKKSHAKKLKRKKESHVKPGEKREEKKIIFDSDSKRFLVVKTSADL